MRRSSLLLAAVVGFVAPLVAHADRNDSPATTPTHPAKTKAKANTVVVTAPAPRKVQRTRYEITNVSAAGSHLPVVVYHHDGLMYTGGNSFTPRKEYRRENGHADVTGASNVGGELLSLDPAFH